MKPGKGVIKKRRRDKQEWKATLKRAKNSTAQYGVPSMAKHEHRWNFEGTYNMPVSGLIVLKRYCPACGVVQEYKDFISPDDKHWQELHYTFSNSRVNHSVC